MGLLAHHADLPPQRIFDQKPWVLKLIIASVPAPWIACFMGWFVAEYGRQPWTIGEVLPTYLSASSRTVGNVIGSMIALVVLYTDFLIAEAFLMDSRCTVGLRLWHHHHRIGGVPDRGGFPPRVFTELILLEFGQAGKIRQGLGIS